MTNDSLIHKIRERQWLRGNFQAVYVDDIEEMIRQHEADFFAGTGEPMPVDRPDLRGEIPDTAFEFWYTENADRYGLGSFKSCEWVWKAARQHKPVPGEISTYKGVGDNAESVVRHEVYNQKSGHEGTEDCVMEIIRRLQPYLRTTEPVSVSLEKCKQAVGKVFIPDDIWNIEEGRKLEQAAKAVLESLKAQGVQFDVD